MFTVTGVVVRLFHEKQRAIAEDWRTAGEVNLKAGRAKEAIEDFRSALLYSPDSALLQLELAQALAEQGQMDEAQNYLFNLRTRDPENAQINLELARISARQGNADGATTYYHDAMYGHWGENAHDHRLAAREELIEYFLKTGRRDSARAEALSMAVENPADPEVRAQAGAYLLNAGDASSALAEFRRTERLEPGNLTALAGAGKASLALGDFPGAARYFTEALERGAKDPEIARERDAAAQAVELDPFVANLTDTERRRRVLQVFHAAEERAKACLPGVFAASPASIPDNLKNLAAQRAALPKQIGLGDLTKHPELEGKALSWALNAEKVALLQCGPGGAREQAIALIAGRHKES